MAFINIGFGNMINDDKVVVMITPDSAPAKRMVAKAREDGVAIDATQGRRTRALLVTESGQVVLSALVPETIADRTRKTKLQDSQSEETDNDEA